jgi:hypothetical protein
MKNFKGYVFAIIFLLSSYCANSSDPREPVTTDSLARRSLPFLADNIGSLVEELSVGDSLKIMAAQLRESAKTYDKYDAYWDMENATKNWLTRVKLLKMAIALGDEEAQKIYADGLESKRYSKECYDCFILGTDFDPKIVLNFFWEHLAYEDDSERESLIKAYKEGVKIHPNPERLLFWQAYSPEKVS